MEVVRDLEKLYIELYSNQCGQEDDGEENVLLKLEVPNLTIDKVKKKNLWKKWERNE